MGAINRHLGTYPSGIVSELKDDDVTRILREGYIDNREEKKRKEAMRKRVDLYKDRGESYFEEIINKQFSNSMNRRVRKKLIEIAMYQNLTKRLTREVSAVYSEPATRKIGAKTMQARYVELQKHLRLDRRMRLANRMVNLCNEAVIWFDLDVMGQPVVRVVTPDNFWAVSHPNDPLHLIALIFDRHPGPGEMVTPVTPRYNVLTEDEFFSLNDAGRLIASSRKPHHIGRIPAILCHREEPDTCLLDSTSGKDIISAHEALALVNIMLLKHQKSGTKQAYAAGDIGDMPRGQQMDEEHILHAPEGVTLSTIDLGADPSSYIDTGRAIIKQIAANYGIPESVFDLSYQATSGFEIELKRLGLREIRRDQILDWRPIERELASIMETVLSEADHSLAFNTQNWVIDFGEVETPQDPMARLMYWEKARQMALIDTVEMKLSMNPDLDPEQARQEIIKHAGIEAERVDLLRKLNVSPSTPADGSDRDEEEDEEREEMVQ